MTGNGDREVVRRARASDSAHRLRHPDAACDFGVGHGLADRNLLQRLPDALLESGAANVEREIQTDPRRLDETHNACNEALVVAVGADETRPRKTILEIANEPLGIVSEQNRGDALRTRSDEDRTERRLSNSESDLLVGATSAVLRRRHAQHVRRLLIETSAGVEARVVDRLRDGAVGSQSFADFPGPVSGSIVLGSQPGGRLEDAMEMARAAADRRRECL